MPRPDAIYASAIAPGSGSKRPQRTVVALRALLRAEGGVAYDDSYGKHDSAALMTAVLGCSETVLLSWEHSQITAIVACLPNPPTVPDSWPSDRCDLVWVIERSVAGWSFRQVPQLLLVGDRPAD